VPRLTFGDRSSGRLGPPAGRFHRSQHRGRGRACIRHRRYITLNGRIIRRKAEVRARLGTPRAARGCLARCCPDRTDWGAAEGLWAPGPTPPVTRPRAAQRVRSRREAWAGPTWLPRPREFWPMLDWKRGGDPTLGTPPCGALRNGFAACPGATAAPSGAPPRWYW